MRTFQGLPMNQRAFDDPSADRLRLGPFELDLRAGELRGPDGQITALRRQGLEVLLMLGRRAGHVVSKDELMAEIWPGLVVGEGSLAQAVADIRRQLGEAGHRHVRTVARRGYMLVPCPEPEQPPEPAGTSGGCGTHEAPPHEGEPARPLPQRSVRPAGVASAPLVAGPDAHVSPAREAVAASRSTPPRLAARIGAVVLLLVLGLAGWVSLAPPKPPWQTPDAGPPLPADAPALSILVLPFIEDGHEEAANPWLADALHGDLVAALARLPDSHVIARDTAVSFKGRSIDIRLAARETGVRHVVSGRLRQEGSRLGMAFALIDGETGVQRWSGTFDVDRAALAQAVGDFAVAIERTLVGELVRTSAARTAARSPAEVGADDLAMQGYALWYRGVTRGNVVAARALFERALLLDPDSVRAWSGIQFTTANQVLNGWTDDRGAALARHNDAVAQLERVDRDGSQTYAGKTFMLFARRDFAAMLRNTTEWTDRHRLPLAYGSHGAALLFNARFDDAVPVIERALRLGPRDPFRAEWQYRLALAHWGAGRYELARDWSQSAAHTTPTLVWPPIHAAAMLRLGHPAQAKRAVAEFAARHPSFTTAQIAHRVPGVDPVFVDMRERLTSSLRELGLP